MDKNKNRTDLLAAGRKKLQQYRQKKDTKGNSSKSSGKAGKSANDTAAGNVPEAAVTQQHAADGEAAKHDASNTITLSESSSRVDSVASGTGAASDGLSAEANVPEKTSISEAAPLEGSGADKARLNKSADDACHVSAGVPQKDGSASLVPKETDRNFSSEFSSKMEGQHGEEQVTEVGAMQDVGRSSGIQIDKGVATQLEGDGVLSSNNLHETAGGNKIASSGHPREEKETNVASQPSKTNDASSTDVATDDAKEARERHGDLVATGALTKSSSVSTVSQQKEGISAGSSNKEKMEALNFSGTHGDVAKSLGYKQLDLSSLLDGSVIELSQLAEIFRLLDEDEFRFVLMSRDSSHKKFGETEEMKIEGSFVRDAFERLKEELYVTSFSKDAFHLQLSEHQKLIDEVSAVNSSLFEVQGKNEVFAKEIEQCRSELKNVFSEREALQKQLYSSKTEVECFEVKVNELQNKLEITQGEMSNLSSELVDCRNLVETLQVENKNLSESFKVASEEKKGLSEENGIILHENEKLAGELVQSKASLESLQTLLRDDKKRVQVETDSLVRENDKLLADLADLKSTLEALEVENKNLNEFLTSVSVQRTKLEEDKVLVVHQMETVSKELMDCKDLVVTLQTEISNLNGHLTSMTEERNKLEEEKKSVCIEYEKQSHELAEIKGLEAGLQAECRKAVDDLKEAMFRINQLTEEKKCLNADLEVHNLKIKEHDQSKHSSQSEEVADRGVRNDTSTLNEPISDSSSLEQPKLDVYDYSSGFEALKRKLEDAEYVMQKLEKGIEGLSTSLSRSTDKVAKPAVSKLIQAFESKRHADDEDSEKSPSSENQTTEDPYTSTKSLAGNLRVLLKELVADAGNAGEFCRVMQRKLLADAAGTKNKYDSLREHADQAEVANIELMVLYEAMRESTYHAVAKEGELLNLHDALHNQKLVLKLENSHLREKLNEFQAKISALQSQLDGMCTYSDETVASISNKVQTLLTEVADRESALKEEWNSICAQVIQTVDVLDSTVQTFYANSSSAGEDTNLDVVGRVAASVNGASKVIEVLRGQLETAYRDHQEISNKNDMALNALHRLHNELSVLVSRTYGYHSDEIVLDDQVRDLLQNDVLNTLLDQLKLFVGERLQLESENEQLKSQLMSRVREIDELEKNCLKSDNIKRLVQDIEQSVKLEWTEIHADEPASHLESLIYLLVQKHKEADQGLILSTSLEMQSSGLRERVEQLNFTLLQYENENLVFKHSLKSAEEDVVVLTSKIQEKVSELEQSEQRVSSLREKLSIAVTKGKGLISQRDSLKQSLAETSKELEKCSQELLSKDARVHELETKLKVYSEAGERMEALESELSYIRNSATALRESFLLKDSVLQRIEEILEDLDLPEHFHSRDIIEKIDWLAKSIGDKSLPTSDWEGRSPEGGGSYSGEDMQPNPNSGEDLRRRFEELQNRFYGLAEQNEMLEQSLMERNNLVQRWEEILDRVDMPSQLRSMEPESKIQWLESALSEAQNHCYSLQQKVDKLETFCGSLTADVEDSKRRTSELEAAFQQACLEKETLSRDLEVLSHDNAENAHKMADFKIKNENLQNEVSTLQELKLCMEEDVHHTKHAIRRLHELVIDALQDSCPADVVIGQEGVEYFEEMLRKLVEKCETLASAEPVNVDPIDVHVSEKEEQSHTSRDFEDQDMLNLNKKLEDSLGEMMCLKEERDKYMLNNETLLSEVEELKVRKKELEALHSQEEQKSASLREKLNVAVRKGKSLVQQRDGMKQVIEELNAEVERLKSEAKHNEKAICEYEEKMKNLFTTQERVQAMESANTLLKNRLAETEYHLQEHEGSWRSIMDSLANINFGLELNSENPVEKLKELGKYLNDTRNGLNSLEQESRKSKRAAELLLAELNEVQERNDNLQDELAKADHELSELSRERDLAENAKYEALAHVEKLSYLHAEEKDRQLSEIMVLKSGMDNMREDISAIERELGNVLSEDLEVLHNVKAMMKSFLQLGGTPAFSAPFSGGMMSRESAKKVLLTEIGSSLRERLYNHSHLLEEEVSELLDVVINVHREYASLKESSDSVKKDVKKLELIEKEKESQLHTLQGNISLLYETCASTISEIKHWKDHVVGNSRTSERNSMSQISIERENSFDNDTHIFNEDGIRGMRDKLLLVVRDFISMQSEFMEVGQSEMKSTILNLQKELQEKDIQRDRISMELVNQIKEAESNAKNYLHDLQQVKGQLKDSQRQLNVKEEERKVLENRVRELQDQETNSTNLQHEVNTLTDALTAKVQEIEALTQALEEQEAEMEDLASKIGGLENELQQKNKDLENLEASRAKALKKLSVTVSKFDELHSLSENLLAEVEKLQSQLQERDGEISFLRQEVTRCTTDALAVTQMSKTKSSEEVQDLISWLASSISRVQVHDAPSDDSNRQENKEFLQKKILDVISELENLRLVAQNSDILLREERSKVEELEQREQYLKNSLHEKESELVMLQGAGDSAKATNSSSEIVEVEQMTNKWVSGTVAPQVRSLRKTNNDQVAIAIDVDHNSERLEHDDDDDKAHGFKSLTTSKVVPRFTRPVSDVVDGLWMSCDRALMRQPALRLGLIIYWAVLHALIATYFV